MNSAYEDGIVNLFTYMILNGHDRLFRSALRRLRRLKISLLWLTSMIDVGAKLESKTQPVCRRCHHMHTNRGANYRVRIFIQQYISNAGLIGSQWTLTSHWLSSTLGISDTALNLSCGLGLRWMSRTPYDIEGTCRMGQSGHALMSADTSAFIVSFPSNSSEGGQRGPTARKAPTIFLCAKEAQSTTSLHSVWFLYPAVPMLEKMRQGVPHAKLGALTTNLLVLPLVFGLWPVWWKEITSAHLTPPKKGSVIIPSHLLTTSTSHMPSSILKRLLDLMETMIAEVGIFKFRGFATRRPESSLGASTPRFVKPAGGDGSAV